MPYRSTADPLSVAALTALANNKTMPANIKPYIKILMIASCVGVASNEGLALNDKNRAAFPIIYRDCNG